MTIFFSPCTHQSVPQISQSHYRRNFDREHGKIAAHATTRAGQRSRNKRFCAYARPTFRNDKTHKNIRCKIQLEKLFLSEYLVVFSSRSLSVHVCNTLPSSGVCADFFFFFNFSKNLVDFQGENCIEAGEHDFCEIVRMSVLLIVLAKWQQFGRYRGKTVTFPTFLWLLGML